MNDEPTLTPELIADLRHIRDVQLSVRGVVAYVLGPWGKREEYDQAAIWTVPADPAGGDPVQFTTGEANDTMPRWSPDGSRLAFLSDRAEHGTAQLYCMPADGGEAIALTSGKRPVCTFAWSPRCDVLAYVSADEPGEDEERREKERDDPHVFGERWQYGRLRTVPAAGGDAQTLLSGDRHVEQIAWAPDGSALACLVRPSPELDLQAHTGTVVEVTVDGGEERLIGAVNGFVENLTYSPDGAWLLYGAAIDGRAQGSSALWRLPVAGGAPEHVVGGEDVDIFNPTCPPGAGRLACEVAQGLNSRVAWLDVESRTLQTQTVFEPADGSFHGASLVVRDEQLLLAVALSLPQALAEIYAGKPAGELIKRTDHHAELHGIRFGSQEDFYWSAPDGWKMDGILIRPVGKGPGPHPTIVLVHGGPYGRWERGCHLSWGDWGQWLATDGYAVLMPNPRGGYGHGNTFAAAARGDVGGADWLDVVSAVDAAIERGIADPERLGIGGWSQGGFMTAWAVTQTHRFKAGIDGAGPTEWGWMAATSDMGTFEAELGGSTPWDGPGPHRHAEISPLSFAARVTTPLLILHGERDERVPVSQATSFHRALRGRSLPVEMVIYPREPHGIRERNHQIDLLRRVRAWFERYVVEADASHS